MTTPPPGFPPGPTPGFPPQPPAPEEPARRDPLSTILFVVIVVAVVLAGLLGAELYVRHTANSIVAKAVSCVVQDSASASFGARPFLIQHFTHSYRDMTVETAGNQIREAKGMKLTLTLDDVRINPTADSAGTLGALDADVAWSTEGIKQTVQGIIPFVGGLINDVTTDPSSGTLELQSALGAVTVKPGVVDGGLAMEVVTVSGLGFTLPRESVHHSADPEPSHGNPRRYRRCHRHRRDRTVHHPRRNDSQRAARPLLRRGRLESLLRPAGITTGHHHRVLIDGGTPYFEIPAGLAGFGELRVVPVADELRAHSRSVGIGNQREDLEPRLLGLPAGLTELARHLPAGEGRIHPQAGLTAVTHPGRVVDIGRGAGTRIRRRCGRQDDRQTQRSNREPAGAQRDFPWTSSSLGRTSTR